MSNPVLSLKKDRLRGVSMFDVTPKPELVSQLSDMGFPAALCEQACIHTKNRDLQSALDWLIQNPNGIQEVPTTSTADVEVEKYTPIEPVSTVHSLPPQPEKVKSKYSEAEEEKRKHEEKQRHAELERMKREKIEKEKEKERIAQMLKEDRENRRAKTSATTSVAPTVVSNTNQPPKTQHTSCLLQFRLPNGQVEKHQFPATHTLKQVHEFIASNFIHDDSFSLITTFPKKEFSGKELEVTLQQADLVPRGVLVIQPIATKGVVKKYEAPLDDSTVDTDTMSYEQLLELEDKVGYVNKGVKKDTKENLPTRTFQPSEVNQDTPPTCLVCQCEYETGDMLKTLPCLHEFHKDCIDQWFQSHSTCPVCKLTLPH